MEEVITTIFNQNGAICDLFVLLYLQERADRKEAWKNYNKLLKETNEVINKVVLAFELIKLHKDK